MVVSFEGVDIEAGTLAEVDNDFVTEPIQKCDRKINDQDYDGAITNSRSLAESTILHNVQKLDVEYEHKGEMTVAYIVLKI